MNVRAINLLLGTQMRDLLVYPQDTATDHVPDRSLPADQQLEEAVQANEATTMASNYA